MSLTATEISRLIGEWRGFGPASGRPSESWPEVKVTTLIEGYSDRVTRQYRDVSPNIAALAKTAALCMPKSSFGLKIAFACPTTIEVHDAEFVLFEPLRQLIAACGPVLMSNVQTAIPIAVDGQKNIFPDLHFHIDRGRDQRNQYSLFVRDPRDAEHRPPRKTSTLFVANIVAHLQALREGQRPEPGQQALYRIFDRGGMKRMIGDIILEQPWSESEGTGELAILHNRDVLHASYYRPKSDYKIGVRYLI